MKKVVFFIAFTMMYCGKPAGNKPVVYGLVIHGGAGTITRENMSSEKESAYRGKLTEALAAGFEILEKGGSSMDAVETTIRIMEDSPLFNAGKGAVFTNAGLFGDDVPSIRDLSSTVLSSSPSEYCNQGKSKCFPCIVCK